MIKLWAAACLLSSVAAWAQSPAPAPAPTPAPARNTATQPRIAKPAAKPAPPGRAASAAEPAATLVKPGFAVTIGAVPGWVVPVAPAAGAPAQPAPMHYRLIDEQVRVAADTSAEYHRVVRVVNQASGLGTAAQFEVEYDPAFESIVLHGLDVVREGQRQPRLDRQRIELLQREKQLEQRIYDGRVTASIVVDDVRVGDQLDFSYTIVGQNPVFGGRFVRHGWLASIRGPALLYRTRLLAPEGRNIRQAVGPADVKLASNVENGWRETVFTRENVAQMRFEPGAPFSVTRAESLQLSEFADWAEVAAWGERLFRDAAAGPRTAAKAAEIRAAQPTPAAQALEALRFVQQEVRYFGIELGAGSHKPNPADQVLQQRFGDCKDKVTLLATLLRALDIPVQPVLVSTRLRDRLDGWIPSPLAFDHVIARVELDGKPLYLDPTRTHQSGPVAVRQVIGLGSGLALAPGVDKLSALPSPFEVERMRVEDRFVVRQFTEPVQLESRIVYRGDLAEAFREAIATQGIAAVADSLGAPYLKSYPKLRRLAPAEAVPVPDDDAIAIVQRFELPSFWRFPEERALVGDVALWAPVEMLLPPKTESRQQPLGYSFPGITRHIATLQLPEDVFRQPGSQRQEEGDANFKLLVKSASTQREVEYSAEARILSSQVEPAQWQGFVATLTKALNKLGAVTVVPPVPLARFDALQTELRTLDDNLRRGRIKAATGTQAQSHFKLLILSAQLDGGRLAGPLKAQALVARGIAQDHLGRLDAGKADFEAALALDGESIEPANGAADNAVARGDFERGIALATQVLARQPKNAQALGTRARANYLAGNLDAARTDCETLLEDPGNVRRGYPLAMLALATRRSGQDIAALKARFPREQWPSEWPRPLVEQAFDGGDGRQLLVDAKAQKGALEAQTEAYFYLGELAAAGGDLRRAREHWQRAVDFGVVEYVEFSAAKLRLQTPR